MSVPACCDVEARHGASVERCPACDQPGRTVDPITVKALLRPEALARLSASGHRFCSTASCPVVYFGADEAFDRGDVMAPVYQKEPPGDRTLCYCFAIKEGELRREIAETGETTATQRITDHVKAGRCACEIKNPHGACCLGNVVAAVKVLQGEEARVLEIL